MDTEPIGRADSASGHARARQVATGSGVGTSMDFFISSKQLYKVCGLRPDAGPGGILDGSAHGRRRVLHVPLHARACGLRLGRKSPLAGAFTCANLGMAAEAHVDQVTTLTR